MIHRNYSVSAAISITEIIILEQRWVMTAENIQYTTQIYALAIFYVIQERFNAFMLSAIYEKLFV